KSRVRMLCRQSNAEFGAARTSWLNPDGAAACLDQVLNNIQAESLALGDRGRQANEGFEDSSAIALRYSRPFVFDLKDCVIRAFDLETETRQHRGTGRRVLGRVEKQIFEYPPYLRVVSLDVDLRGRQPHDQPVRGRRGLKIETGLADQFTKVYGGGMDKQTIRADTEVVRQVLHNQVKALSLPLDNAEEMARHVHVELFLEQFG